MHPLIPLLIVLIIILVGAVVGFVIYTVATDIASHTSKKMEDHNITFNKDGLRVGVNEMKNEDYVGRTQDVLVKAWNLSTWPAYKSRFWNKQDQAQRPVPGGRSSSSRSGGAGSSSAAGNGRSPSPSPSRSMAASSASGRTHASGTHRTENGRLAEPRPSIRRSASGTSIPGSFD